MISIKYGSFIKGGELLNGKGGVRIGRCESGPPKKVIIKKWKR
jgi:hypothetical protein